MASDEDYMAFLNKANRDVSGGGDGPSTSASKEFKAMEAGDQAPQVIRDATKDAFYTSDADEPFKEVSLKYEGDSLPDEGSSLLLPLSLSRVTNTARLRTLTVQMQSHSPA